MQARRSMRYSKELVALGDAYRRSELDSEDEQDGTLYDEDWTKMKVSSVH